LGGHIAHIVIIGAGIGGMSQAYELRAALGREHRITVVGEGERFSFTPSNPWVAVGWRRPDEVQIEVRERLAKKDIAFESSGMRAMDPSANRITLTEGLDKSI
jgi:sulfide:quinone oxidoreductase